jgi:hypothetical protein
MCGVFGVGWLRNICAAVEVLTVLLGGVSIETAENPFNYGR